MAGRWSLHLFDWDRHQALAPRLREAAASDDFGHLHDPEADDLLEELDESATPEEVCNAILLHLCVSAETAAFEQGLPELILWLRRREDAEIAAEALGALLSTGPNVEGWFQCESGIVGILTSSEVQTLNRELTPFREGYRPARIRGWKSLTRMLTTTDPASEVIDHLLEIVGEAANRGTGLVAVLEN
jgi:hypothetical protein